jgi:hypothetical protein
MVVEFPAMWSGQSAITAIVTLAQKRKGAHSEIASSTAVLVNLSRISVRWAGSADRLARASTGEV